MMRRMSLVALFGATLALPLLGTSEEAGTPPLDARSTADAPRPVVVLLVIDGGINPATVEYIRDGVAAAEAQQAAALLIQLDTPGGLLDSTKSIVKDILGAPRAGDCVRGAQRGGRDLSRRVYNHGGKCGGDGVWDQHRGGASRRWSG